MKYSWDNLTDIATSNLTIVQAFPLSKMSSRNFILFAEDDSDHAMLLALACKRSGVPKSSYVICGSGLEAISFLEKSEGDDHPGPWPTRIVTDFRMPFLDGIGVIAWVKRNRRFQDVPVTLMSTFLSDEDEARARSLGADEILIKPARFEELVRHVNRWYADLTSIPKTPEPLALP